MEYTEGAVISKSISWGSIIAGVITSVAVSLLLTMLGTSIGLALLSPQDNDIINGADKTVLIWSVVSFIVSLGCGGFVAGRLAGKDGAIHGFLSWATSLVLVSVLGLVAAGSVFHFAGNIVGSTVSATGSAAKGLGNIAGTATEATVDMGKTVAEKLGFDTRLAAMPEDSQIEDALRKSKIEELQPDYLHSQLQGAGNDLAAALKELAIKPDDSSLILNNLISKLKSRLNTINKGISRTDVKNALASNTLLSPEESDKAVDHFMQARKKAVQEINYRVNQLENAVDDAEIQYAQFKEEAKAKADEVAHAGAVLALWSFFGLLAGAVVSALTGFCGGNMHPACRMQRV
ncbi:CAP-Gly protein [Enterobacter cloacae]|uniref:CAP-Gly protein n=1 Tax=Enterobacter cloacae TaxID=550 RepID=UPI002FF5BEA1